MNSHITVANVQELLALFAKSIYRAKDNEQVNCDILDRCLALFELDHNVVEISNRNGELSSHYPSRLFIPETEKNTSNGSSTSTASAGSTTNAGTANNAGSSMAGVPSTSSGRQETIYEHSLDAVKLREQIKKARFARSRTRFPIPVILYKGKYVCRSSTLSSGAEMYTRSGLNYFFNGGTSSVETPSDDDPMEEDHDAYEAQESYSGESNENGNKSSNSDWPLFDQIRSQDIKLLKTLNVGTIIDFMVEKKKVKFGLKVTSSEKVDKENRYSDFKIVSLPYPGCEFFKSFRDNNYSHDSLVFDWNQQHVNVEIGIPSDTTAQQLNSIDWDEYKAWDLVTITQNYMKLCLKYMQDNNSGVLIHCISGWDRTPLFISMLRLSLWADGVIHQSLNAVQVLYLTIAYDWYMFGHDLPDRLNKGEEIFVFCFYALKYIQEEDYSMGNNSSRHNRSKHNSSGSSSIAVLPNESDSNMDNCMFDDVSRCSSASLTSNSSQHDSANVSAETIPDYPPRGSTPCFIYNHDSNSSIEVLNEPHTPSSSSQSNSQNFSCFAKRTSPVTVPTTSMQRQRNESTSSVGSWQMITNSGSLRSNDSSNFQYLKNATNSQESSGTLIEEEEWFASYNQSAGYLRRKDRMQSLRNLFYQCYCRAIGFKYKNGTENSSIGSMLSNFAERVGITNQQPSQQPEQDQQLPLSGPFFPQHQPLQQDQPPANQ